ncbi:MAG: hypothetical protein LBU12_03485 [Deltaproteobacteria bacterium]|nr:hypothetical protein [Deltaproteobacteria bacterium]
MSNRGLKAGLLAAAEARRTMAASGAPPPEDAASGPGVAGQPVGRGPAGSSGAAQAGRRGQAS